ncbi:MAG TPA: PQQ-binding-like beta-propeller repeat protein [Solirubrobacteraceae bacterium]|jgi:outer membrane protein assembly factor BamB|nr:PQQ-binding-like beta-propeller repeat protein [Solirubrobacteraceae bacterium]
MSKRSRGAKVGGSGQPKQQASSGQPSPGGSQPAGRRAAGAAATKPAQPSSGRIGPLQIGGAVIAIVVVAVVLVLVLGSSKSNAPAIALTGSGYENINASNTRATGGPIDAATASKLKVLWSIPLTTKSAYGAYASTPVIANGVVYSIDLDSNVQAIDLHTGKALWSNDLKTLAYGPNGLAVAGGEVFGTTETSAFALEQKTGKEIWSVSLVENEHEGIDMAPGYHNGIVYVSTVPGNLTSFYEPGANGVLWAMEAKTGKKLWHFDTSPPNLWGDSGANSGGGVWYPPAFDNEGNMYFGTGNPEPQPGTESQPWGSSRPGPNLYNDSVVKLNATTGKLEWYYQVTPHDLYDWDQQDPPILGEVDGKQAVISGGKSGIVVALERSTGKLLWRHGIGRHNGHDQDGLFAMRHEYSKLKMPETVYPGKLGGVIAQMSSNGSTVFAPVVNLPANYTTQTQNTEGPEESGEVTAMNTATGLVRWSHKFPAPAFAATTVVNNLVFVATSDGELYGLNTSNGEVAFESELPAGSIGGVAVEGNTLVVGAGQASTASQKPALVAYSLGG